MIRAKINKKIVRKTIYMTVDDWEFLEEEAIEKNYSSRSWVIRDLLADLREKKASEKLTTKKKEGKRHD